MNAKPVKAAGLNFAGVTGLSAPPDDPEPAAGTAVKAKPRKAAAKRVPARKTAAAPPELDELPQRPPAQAERRKLDFYLGAAMADDVDDLVAYAVYRFRMKKGQVQDMVVAIGMDNRAEIMRQLHERAYGTDERTT